MMSAATYTSPFPLTEFQSAIDLSARGAGLGRRCPAVNLYDVHTVPLTFVRQLTDKLPERRVADRLCQVMIAPHAAHVQVLDEYRSHLAIVRQFMSYLVQKVVTLVPDLRVALGDYMFLSGSVVRAGLLSGKDALLAAKTSLGLEQSLRIVIAPTVGTDNVTAVQVYANTRLFVNNGVAFEFPNSRVDKNGRIVPVTGALTDDNVFDRAVKRPMQYGLDILALWNGDCSVLPVNTAALRVVKRLPGTLALRNRMVRTALPPVSESIRTLLDGILQRLGVNFTNPRINLFQRHKLCLGCKSGDTVSATNPKHRRIVQGAIICNTATTETLGKELGLSRSRVETIFIRPQHITNLLKFHDKNKRKSNNYEQISIVNAQVSEPVDPLILRGICGTHIGKDSVKYIASQKSKTFSSPG